MSEMELRANAMLMELRGQRNAALDRCVQMAGDIENLKAKVSELTPKPEAQPELQAVRRTTATPMTSDSKGKG